MPAIHDAAVAEDGDDGSIDHTFNYAVTTGATLLVVMVGVDTTSDRNPVASSDLDGSLTFLAEVIAGAANQACAVYYKTNPTVGTHAITGGTDNVSSADLIEVIAVTFDDTNASTPITDANTDSGSDATISTVVANATTGDLIVDFWVVNGQPTVAAGANQTQIVNVNNGGSAGTTYGMSTQPGSAGADPMSWTWTGNQRTAQVAFRLPAAGGAAAALSIVPILQNYLNMGVM